MLVQKHKEPETNQPERIREIEMLKNMKDLDSEEFEDDEWDGKDWENLSDTGRLKEMVIGEYPLDLLDELARRISVRETKNEQS